MWHRLLIQRSWTPLILEPKLLLLGPGNVANLEARLPIGTIGLLRHRLSESLGMHCLTYSTKLHSTYTHDEDANKHTSVFLLPKC